MLGIHAEQAYRSPAVAGMFYPDAPDAIEQTLRGWFGQFQETRRPSRTGLGSARGVDLFWPYCCPSVCRNRNSIDGRFSVPKTRPWWCKLGGRAMGKVALSGWRGGCRPGAVVCAGQPGSDLEMDARPHATEHAIEVHLPLLAYRQPRAGSLRSRLAQVISSPAADLPRPWRRLSGHASIACCS